MKIELNEKQAQLICDALEEHSRMLCGQIELSHIKAIETALYRDSELNNKFWDRRDQINLKLQELKTLVFPELYANQSHGVGSFPEADLGYEMYKEILYHFENKRQKKEGEKYQSNVNSYKPLKLTYEPTIKITE